MKLRGNRGEGPEGEPSAGEFWLKPRVSGGTWGEQKLSYHLGRKEGGG